MNLKFLLLFPLAFLTQHVMTNVVTSLGNCLKGIIRKDFRGEVIRIYGVEEICQESNGTRTAFLHSRVCFDLSGISTLEATFQVATSDFHTSERIRNIFVLTTNEDSEGLNKITTTMKMTSYWDTRVLVVLIGGNGPRTLIKIFDDIWKKTRLLNTVIMATDEEGNFTLYSWYPYERGHCEIVENLHVIDKCGLKGFDKDNILFPKSEILRGLNSCPVYITASDTPFFSTFKDTPDKSGEGLDMKIIKELTDKYEMSVRFVLPPKQENHWTRFFLNGSLQGTMRMLYNYESDVGMSGFSMVPETFNILSFSNVYFIDAVRWFVPKPKFSQRWKSIFSVFSWALWMTVLTSLLLSTFLIYILRHFKRATEKSKSFFNSLLEIIGITVAQSAVNLPKSFAIRIFFISYMMYSLNITTSYQTVLYGILTAPLPYSPYKSLQDVFDHGLLIYFLPLQIPYYENDSLGEQIFSSYQFRRAANSTAVLRNIAVERKGALMQGNARMRFLFARHYHDANGKPLVDILPETVTLDLIAFHFSPNNPLKELFDSVIFRLTQGGFINKWKMNLLLPQGTIISENHLTSLSLNSLTSAFQLYAILIIVSLIIFLYEISWVHIKRFAAEKFRREKMSRRK